MGFVGDNVRETFCNGPCLCPQESRDDRHLPCFVWCRFWEHFCSYSSSQNILTIISGKSATVSSVLERRHRLFNQLSYRTKAHCGCTSIFHHCAKDAKVKHSLKEDVQVCVHISKIARLKCSPGVVGTVNLIEKKSLVMLPEICPDSSRDAAFESFHSHWVGVLVMPLSYPLFC